MNFLDLFNSIDWVTTAKVVLSVIMLALSFLCLLILFRFRDWHDQLVQMEAAAVEQRDEALMEFTEARARLSVIKNRLFSRKDEQPQQELLQSAGKILMMVMQKERSMFQWGMLGVKVARSAWAYFKNR